MTERLRPVTYPLGCGRAVVIDPAIKWGRPTIAGTGIPVTSVVDLYRGEANGCDDDAALVAVQEWFGLTPDQVLDALAYGELPPRVRARWTRLGNRLVEDYYAEEDARG